MQISERAEFVTIRQLAEQLGVSRTTIRTVLWRHKDQFARPIYRRANRHPRLLRMLSRKEEYLVRTLMGFDGP